MLQPCNFKKGMKLKLLLFLRKCLIITINKQNIKYNALFKNFLYYYIIK